MTRTKGAEIEESPENRLKRLAARGGWIGVDLDGTLAEYAGWKGVAHIGAPVPRMLDRVKAWRAAGIEVRIFTARAGPPNDDSALREIRGWLLEHVGEVLPITAIKDYGMIELWDDRAVQVVANTGARADGAEG